MKRLSVLLVISLLFLLTACSEASSGDKAEGSNSNTNSVKNNESKEKVNLKLQLLKRDEAAGATIESNPIYKLANDGIKKNPQMGEGKGLNLYIVDILTKKSGGKSVLLLVINRYDDPITNISFDLTLGNETDGYVWNKMKTTLPESSIGVLQPHGVVPILIPLSDEQYAPVKSLNKKKSDQQLMKAENIKYDTVK